MRLLLASACLVNALCAGEPAEISTEARAFIETHFITAKSAEAASDFAQAASEYEAILKKYPKAVPEVYQNVGIDYYLTRKYDLAIERFQQGLQLNPEMVGARLFLGITYVITDRPEKGLPHLEFAHRKKPSPESATYLGLAYKGMRRYDAAARYLRSALTGTERKDSLLYFIGETYLKAGGAVANRLAEQNPDSKYDHLISARILDSQDFYQLAAKAYLDAAKKDPQHAAIFFRLGRMLAILGQDEAFRISLDRFHKLAPNDQSKLDLSTLPKSQIAAVGMKVDYEAELRALPAPNTRPAPVASILNGDVNDALRKRLPGAPWTAVVAGLVAGRWPETIIALEAVRPAPGDWLRDYLLASVYLWTDDVEKAEIAVNGLASLKKAVPAVEFLRWEIYQQLSFSYYNKLLEDYPQSARAHFLKAKALDAQGKREALDEYQTAIRLDPLLSEVRIALADYYLSNSRYKEALAECQRVLETDPWSSPPKMRLGRIYVQLRQPDKGIPYLLDGLKAEPQNAEGHMDLARGYELSGKPELAIGEYRLALKIDPSMNRIHYVLGRIYRTQGKASLADREYQIFEENEANERNKQRERLRQALGGKVAEEQ
jgi:tetratricopeptide (TPR) repeat protein